jgi:hypothetical protein
MFPPEGVSKAPCIVHEVAMTTPRTNTIGETLSKHDEHEDCPPVGSAKHTPGHKLVTKAIQRDGRFGLYWTCECGGWHPPPAVDAPWGPLPAPRDTVVAYIKRMHREHAAAIARTTGANQ